MKTKEKRLKALSERLMNQRTFSRIVVIHELPIKSRILLLKNLGVSLKDNRKITNQSELERIEKLPEDEWKKYVAETQARCIADTIAQYGGREGLEKFIKIEDDFNSRKFDGNEHQRQLDLFFKQLRENQIDK